MIVKVVVPDSIYARVYFARGEQGPQGATGPQGVQGSQGPQGSPGTNGSNGTNGADGVGYTGVTSTSNITIGSGLKTWSVASSQAFQAGMRIRAIHSDTPSYWMEGFCQVATSSTIIITVDKFNGSGSHNSWKFAVSGEVGQTGATGATGATGPSGVIAVTAPITNTGTSTSAIIGIDQTGLTLAQSQITNLVTDLAGKANLAGGNNLTGLQTLTNSATGSKPFVVNALTGTSVNLAEFSVNAGIQANINNVGIFNSNNANGFQIAGAMYYGSLNGGQSARIQAGPAVGANPHVVVRGVASASGNLQEWQNSAGTVLSRIKSDGTPTFSYGTFFGSQLLSADGDAVRPLLVRGFSATQSGNLTEWQNSAGSILARVVSDGAIRTVTGFFGLQFATLTDYASLRENNSGGRLQLVKQTAADSNPGANNARIYFRDGTTAGTLKLVVRAGAAGAETTILDNIPQ